MIKETEEIIADQILGSFSDEEVTAFGAIAKSVEKVNELKKLKRKAGTDNPGMQVLPEGDEPFNTTLDDEMIHMVKGAGFGKYLHVRGEGHGEIAKDIMLNAGIPQELNVKQTKWLERFDKRYKISEGTRSLQRKDRTQTKRNNKKSTG